MLRSQLRSQFLSHVRSCVFDVVGKFAATGQQVVQSEVPDFRPKAWRPDRDVLTGLTNWSGGAGKLRGRILGGGRRLLQVRDQAGCEIRQGRSGASGAAQFPGEGAGRPRHLHGVRGFGSVRPCGQSAGSRPGLTELVVRSCVFDAIGVGIVKARGFGGLVVRWTVKTHGFVGLDVCRNVKTRGFVDPGVWRKFKSDTP